LEDYLKRNSDLFRVAEQVKIKYLSFKGVDKAQQNAHMEAKKARDVIYQETTWKTMLKETTLLFTIPIFSK